MAFVKGMANSRLETAIKSETSHLQIHTPKFLDVNNIENYFTESNRILNYAESLNGVRAASKRLIVNSIISSAEKGGGIRLIGIEPGRESQVTNISEKIIEGGYLEPLKRGRPIMIGQKLAEKLDVKIGSKLVAGLLDVKGEPIYYQFRVNGIFKTVSGPFDMGTAFVSYDDLESITGIPENSAHEIAIYADSEEITGGIAENLKTQYPKLAITEWFEIMPELGYLTGSMDTYMYIIISIILLALGFGIVNTMLMVVLERVKELGMLMAVGMNKLRVFYMIMLETVFLSLTGGVLGIILGAGISSIFKTRGLNLASLYKEGLEALGYESVVYTIIKPDMLFMITLLVILTGIIASIYPALKALALNPSEAIRTDN